MFWINISGVRHKTIGNSIFNPFLSSFSQQSYDLKTISFDEMSGYGYEVKKERNDLNGQGLRERIERNS